MADFPLWSGSGVLDAIGADEAASAGTTVTADATANTKGAYTELVAATAQAYEVLLLAWSHPSVNTAQYLLDLAIGAAGSEVLILENLQVTQDPTYVHPMWLPLRIPAGVRLAARLQCSTGGATGQVQAIGIGGGWRGLVGFDRATVYGASTADSGGVAVTNAAAINTKSAWTEIVAVTTGPIKLLYLTLCKSNASTTFQANDLLFDIGVGAAGSEVVLVPNIPARASTADRYLPSVLGPFPVDLPAGVRLSVREQYTVQDIQSRNPDATLVGLG